jgi:dienelactone hydrolase
MRPLILLTLSCVALVTACGDLPRSEAPLHVVPVFDPASGRIPTPNELLMDPTTGRVTLPIEPTMSAAEVEYIEGFLNTLDGFPVNSSLSCLFSSTDVDPATLDEEGVRIYDVTEVVEATRKGVNAPATGITPLPLEGFSTTLDTIPDADGQELARLTLHPLTPLAPGRRFAVVLTSAISTTAGAPLAPGALFNLLKSRSPLIDKHGNRTVFQASLDDAAALVLEQARRDQDAVLTGLEALSASFDRAQVVLMWTFPTHRASVMQLDPQAGALPLPNDLLMSEGRVALPTPADAPPVMRYLIDDWMNTLDGWRSDSVIDLRLTRPVAEGGITLIGHGAAPSVAVLDVTDPAAPGPITGLDVTNDSAGRVTLTLPQRFTHGHRYLVAVSRGLATRDGDTTRGLVPSAVQAFLLMERPLWVDGVNQMPRFLSDADAARLEAARTDLDARIPNLAGYELDRASLAGMFTFTISSRGEHLFDPTRDELPLPNDLLMEGGLLALPIPDGASDAEQALLAWMNQLDGYGHTMSGGTHFSVAPDADLLTDAFEALRLEGAAGVPSADLIARAAPGDPFITIAPATWLEPDARYAVVLTHALRDEDDQPLTEATLTRLLKSPHPIVDEEGRNLLAGLIADADAPALEERRRSYAPLFDELDEGLGIPREDVLAFWTFETHSGGEAIFDPAIEAPGFVPSPSDLLRVVDEAGSARLNLPLPDGAGPQEQALIQTLNTLDGYATLAAMTATVSGVVDAATITPYPRTGPLIEDLDAFDAVGLGVADITPMLQDPDNPLAKGDIRLLGEDRVVTTVDGDQLRIEPVSGFPWEGGHTYLVTLFDQAMTQAGAAFEPSPSFTLVRGAELLSNDLGQSQVSSLTDADAARLEAVRLGYQPLLEDLEGPPLNVARERVRLAWTFTVQAVEAPLAFLRERLAIAPMVEEEAVLGGDLIRPAEATGYVPDWVSHESGHLHAVVPNGRMQGHLLLGSPVWASPETPDLPAFRFDADGAPAWNTTETDPQRVVPFVLSIPKNVGAVSGPYPVVIFMHGLGGSRHDMWSVADKLASAGLASLAIDAVYHGARAALHHPDGPQMIEDPRATFLSSDLTATRDSFRQTTLDLLQVARLIREGALNQWLLANDHEDLLGGNDMALDDEIGFLGVSFGALIGLPFVVVEEDVRAAALNVPAAHLALLLDETESEWLSGALDDILAELGGERLDALASMQWILDPADALNVARRVCSAPLEGHDAVPVLVQEAALDEIVPASVSDELVRALEHEGCVGQIRREVYASSTHDFLTTLPQGASHEAQLERARARADVAQFLGAHVGQ